MAKRNSTKTATKEAMSASEPKVLALAGWNGVNFQNTSPDSLPSDWFNSGERDTQTNMKPKNLMIQNNVILRFLYGFYPKVMNSRVLLNL